MTAAYDTELPSAYAAAHPSSTSSFLASATARPEPGAVTSRSPNEPDGRSQAGIAVGAGIAPSGANPSSAGKRAETISAAPATTLAGPIRTERLKAATKIRLEFAIE